MPRLHNITWEKFCLYLAEGHSQPEAYTLARVKGALKSNAVTRSAACRLAARDDIKQRRAELVDEAFADQDARVRKHIITKPLVIDQLRQEAIKATTRAKTGDFVKCWVEIAKLAGLYKTVEGHQGDVHVTINLTPATPVQIALQEERRAGLAAIHKAKQLADKADKADKADNAQITEGKIDEPVRYPPA